MSINSKLNLDKFKYENRQPPYDKVCFGMGGQYGDIIMQEPGLRKFIEDNPETKIVLAICDKYKDIQPLFYNYHKNIIDFKVWQGYDDWPTQSDLDYIKQQSFDAMFPFEKPYHEQSDWAKHRHLVEETALMLGVEASTNKIELKMPEDVVKEPKTVAIHLFSSKWPGGTRSVNIKKQEYIAKYLCQKGYKVYQLSGPHQPHIRNTTFVRGTYFDSCKKMLSTDLLVTCDSGMPWVASAFNHPTVGLYSTAYDPLVDTTKNWQPVNPNAVYLEGQTANFIDMDLIIHNIDKKLEETK